MMVCIRLVTPRVRREPVVQAEKVGAALFGKR